MPLMPNGILYLLFMRSTERHREVAPGGAAASAGGMALGEIAFAPAVMGGVGGEAERGRAALDRALDVIVGPGRVAAHIELKHSQRIGRGVRDPFEARIANRAQHMSDAEFGRRLDHRLGTAGMKTFQ